MESRISRSNSRLVGSSSATRIFFVSPTVFHSRERSRRCIVGSPRAQNTSPHSYLFSPTNRLADLGQQLLPPRNALAEKGPSLAAQEFDIHFRQILARHHED